MATTEERLKILKMVEEGKLTPEDAASLLSALAANERKASQARAAQQGGGAARNLRIRVTDQRSGRVKVNLRVPVGLLHLLTRTGTKFNFKTNVDGVDAESILQAIHNNVAGPLIDVIDEKDGERVEIVLE